MKFTNNRNQKSQKNNRNKKQKQVPLMQDLRQLILRTTGKPVKNKAKKKTAKRIGNGAPIMNPVVRSLKGILSPFSAERGSVGGLVDARPSQKFTARGLGSFALPNGVNFVGLVAPNIANGIGQPSFFMTWNGTGALGDATSVVTSSTVGATPLGLEQSTITTNTPYQVTVLDDGTDSWRLLSCGIRARYTGPKLYQGGLVKFYHDTRGDLLQAGENTTLTYDGLVSRLNGHAGVVRASFTNNPEIMVILSSVTAEAQNWAEAPYYSPGNQEWSSVRFGGTQSGKTIGQPIGYLYGVNTSGITMHFDVEIIEHWEIGGASVDALNSPSAGNAELANGLSSLVVAAHQHMVGHPSKKYHDALRTVSRDPHVRAAFTGFASSAVSSALSMLA